MSKSAANSAGGNTSVENYDDQLTADTAPMTQDEILMKEGDILAGILELHREKDAEESYRTIRIWRDKIIDGRPVMVDGKPEKALKLMFRVRPISEEESQQCFRNATRYAKTKPGQPKIPIETDSAKNRSYLIYTATVDEDRAKIWENPKAKQALNVLDGVDMVDMILKAGEKAAVIAVIDEISGYTDDTEELAKN